MRGPCLPPFELSVCTYLAPSAAYRLRSGFPLCSPTPTNRNLSSFANNAEGVNPPQSVYRICNLCSEFSKKCGGFFDKSSAFTCKMRRVFGLIFFPCGTEFFLCGNQEKKGPQKRNLKSWKMSAKTELNAYKKVRKNGLSVLPFLLLSPQTPPPLVTEEK